MKQKLLKIEAVFLSICVCLCLFCSCKISKKTQTALKIGTKSVSVLDLQIIYHICISNFYTKFADNYTEMGIDPSKDYSQQQCYFDSTKTWADFFHDNAIDYCRELQTFLIQAKKDNVSLNDEEKKSVEEKFSGLSETLEKNDMTEQEYIEGLYGSEATINDVKRIYGDIALYSKEYSYLADNFGFTQDDYDDYYEKNRDSIDSVTVRMIPFIYSDDSMTQQQALESAQNFDKSTPDEATLLNLQTEVLNEQQKNYYMDTDYSITFNINKKYFNDTELNKWLFDEDRTYWDSYICDFNGMVTVFKFIEKDTKDYRMVNIRHILVSDTSSDGAEECNKIYDQWSTTAFDENSFSDYAATYSSDKNTSSSGGLIENVYKGKLANELTKWCFDQKHEYGDSGIVLTEYGYHMVLFVSYAENYRQYLCRTALESNAYDKLYSSLKDQYKLKTYVDHIKNIS